MYYYTIDGSTPTEESPVYDGTPIKLPSGRVTLKAVCVNQYGKMSPTLEVGYKFNVSPYPLDMYGESDTFGSFTLNKTSIDEFKAAFGNPSQELETTYLNLTNSCLLYTSNRYNRAQGYVDLNLAIFVRQKDETYLRIGEQQRQYAHSAQLLTELMEAVGFTDIRLYGDKKLSPPEPHAVRWFLAARKPLTEEAPPTVGEDVYKRQA